MTKTIDAIFTNGVLRPVLPLEGIAENDRVKVVVMTPPARHPLEDLVGTISPNEAAAMMKIIDDEFNKVDLDDWK